MEWELGCSPQYTRCRRAVAEGLERTGGYCSVCPLNILYLVEDSWQGKLISSVSGTLARALLMPGMAITLDEIRFDEFLLLNVMREEEDRFRAEEAERQQREQQASYSSPPIVSRIDDI